MKPGDLFTVRRLQIMEQWLERANELMQPPPKPKKRIESLVLADPIKTEVHVKDQGQWFPFARWPGRRRGS
jgi:hypothetical protein